jgi:hypothetical protein
VLIGLTTRGGAVRRHDRTSDTDADPERRY